MTIGKRFLCGLAALGLMTAVQSSGSQQIPGVPAIESGAWTVRMVRFERTGPDFSEYAFYFDVLNRETGVHRIAKLSNETTDLDAVHIVDGKLVILGSIGSSANKVTVFDMKTGEPLDSFLCWWPHISAEGHFIIAVRFYPRFSDPALTSHVVVLYRLSGLPSIPRSQQTEPPLEPIYPQENSRPGAKGMEKTEERHLIDVKAGYLWGAGDRRVAFVDRYENDSWLVIIELRAAM